MTVPRRNPYIWDVLVSIPDVRVPPAPDEDVPPNPARDYDDGRVIIAFSTPPEFLREFTSAILSGVEVLYRDNYDTAQRIADGWLMATEYPLPLRDLATSTETRQIIKSEIDRLIDRLTTGGGESIYPGLPPVAPTEGSDEYDRLCAAAVIFVTWALDSITSGVQDATDALVKITGAAKRLGAKGFIASILVQLADEAIEALIGAAISNQTNIDELSCLLISNLSGADTDQDTFGGVFDRPPYPDPILEVIRAALSLWVRTDGAYAGWLDTWRQTADAPLATLPECPCQPEPTYSVIFRNGTSLLINGNPQAQIDTYIWGANPVTGDDVTFESSVPTPAASAFTPGSLGDTTRFNQVPVIYYADLRPWSIPATYDELTNVFAVQPCYTDGAGAETPPQGTNPLNAVAYEYNAGGLMRIRFTW